MSFAKLGNWKFSYFHKYQLSTVNKLFLTFTFYFCFFFFFFLKKGLSSSLSLYNCQIASWTRFNLFFTYAEEFGFSTIPMAGWSKGCRTNTMTPKEVKLPTSLSLSAGSFSDSRRQDPGGNVRQRSGPAQMTTKQAPWIRWELAIPLSSLLSQAWQPSKSPSCASLWLWAWVKFKIIRAIYKANILPLYNVYSLQNAFTYSVPGSPT